MEELGEKQYFYSQKTDTHYKVVNIKGSGQCSFYNFVVQECEKELFTISVVAIDPDNTKEYKRVEVYEKKPFGRKRQMNYKLFKQIIYDGHDFSQPIVLHMSDKFLYKDVI